MTPPTVGTTLRGILPSGATLTPNGRFAASGTSLWDGVQWFNVGTGKVRTTTVGFRVWWAAVPTNAPDVVAAGERSVAEVDAATGTVLRRAHVGGIVGQPISLPHGLVLVPFGPASGLLVATATRSISVVSMPCQVTASAAELLPPGLARTARTTPFAFACGIGRQLEIIEAEIAGGRVAVLHRTSLRVHGAAIALAVTAMAFSPDNSVLYVATNAVPSAVQSFVNTDDAGVTYALSSRSLRVRSAHWSGTNSIAVTSNGRFVIEANASGAALQVLDTATFGPVGQAERCAVPWQRATALQGTSMPAVNARCASGIDCYAVPHAALGAGFFQWAGDDGFVVVTFDEGAKFAPIWIVDVAKVRTLPRSHTDLNDTGCQA